MKPVMTEKAVMMIERDNKLVFETSMRKTKAEIKAELEEVLKIKTFDVISAKYLGVTDLANGGLGRLTVYTENAIKEIGEKYK